MTQAIERAVDTHLAQKMWGEERLEVLRQQIAPGASDAELDLFAEVCANTKLSPFAKQIWMIPRRRKVKDERGREYYETYQIIQIGVHGLRLIAQRSREFAGEAGPQWTADGKEWVDVWLDDKPPLAARVGVLRKGFAQPVWSVAVWKRAAQFYDGKPMALWATRGPEQLALAAERDALRRAFPLETAGVEAVLDEEQERVNAARYAEIFGKEDDVVVSGDHFVERTTGEVVEPKSSPSTFVAHTNDRGETIHMPSTRHDDDQRAQAIVDQAHAAAGQRDQTLDQIEAERQRRQEGLI